LLKGMTRRVVVVKSPDKKLFEEAVFFLTGDAEKGVSSDQIVAEAQAIAGSFNREGAPSRAASLLRTALWSLAGAALASAVWVLFVFLV
jgi:hypothetical protein